MPRHSKLSNTIRTIMDNAMRGYAPDPEIWFDAYRNTPHPLYMDVDNRDQAELLFGGSFDCLDKEDPDRWLVEEWILAMICLKIDAWIEEEEDWIRDNGLEYPDVAA